ncbi:MAG: pilus assembly protein TadB [Acidimicrobiaceae bacterium]|nr:pilus assembly protein TadB [Acidimicrobiaceae bacterium]
MRTLAGAIVGVLAASGCWIAIAGYRGVAIPDRPARAISVDGLWWRLALVIAGFTAVYAVTRWPAAGVLAGACAWVAPMLIGVRAQRDHLTRRSDAVASWTEMLRDTIASHAGLQEAIAVSAKVAPGPIRAEVQALAIRAERESLSDALRRFAADLEDPVADLVVASLVIAAERQAQRLADLLGHIADAAREQAAMRLRVETSRARTYASSRALVVITFGLAVAMLLFAPSFMEPYDSATGQIVLIGIGSLFAGALGALVRLGRPASSLRLLVSMEPGGVR